MNAFTNLFMMTDRNVSLSVDEAISVSGLRVGYGFETMVKDASFGVNRGERLAVIGPNGAGKSTLLKAMLGLIKPQAGTAAFLDRPFWAVRQHVAYVAQADETDWRFPAGSGSGRHGAGGSPRPDRAAGGRGLARGGHGAGAAEHRRPRGAPAIRAVRRSTSPCSPGPSAGAGPSNHDHGRAVSGHSMRRRARHCWRCSMTSRKRARPR